MENTGTNSFHLENSPNEGVSDCVVVNTEQEVKQCVSDSAVSAIVSDSAVSGIVSDSAASTTVSDSTVSATVSDSAVSTIVSDAVVSATVGDSAVTATVSDSAVSTTISDSGVTTTDNEITAPSETIDIYIDKIPDKFSDSNFCLNNDTNKSKLTEDSHMDMKHSSRDNLKPSSEAIVKIQKPLCADYRSDSDSDSVDSESDSSSSTTYSCTSSDSEDDSDYSARIKPEDKKVKKKTRQDLSLTDLPPIEDLKITVPEDACTEVGTITSIVDTLVIVESYKGTAALDIDTVLFLDNGKRTLGKVFEILGPVSEPVYAVRFNSQEQINSLKIEKGLKVYYAPKTQHTSFVFLAEIMKNRGSDASWKDNIEPPLEFQDFSDDEEEKRCRNNKGRTYSRVGSTDEESRKRPFCKTGERHPVIQPNRFMPPQGRFTPPRFNRFRPAPPPGPFYAFPPRFSGPPFPMFGALPYGNFHPQFHQQRAHGFPEPFRGLWHPPAIRNTFFSPPPPPPPSDGNNAPE